MLEEFNNLYMNNIYIYMKNLNFYSLDVSGTQILRMMVNEDGNVGIGTSIATKKLEVAGDISFNGNIYQNGNLFSGGGGGGGGSSTFTGLSDTPSSFTASKFLAVNSGFASQTFFGPFLKTCIVKFRVA